MTGIQISADYDLKIQVRRNEIGEIVSGVVLGDIKNQNTAIILSCHEGEVKEQPLLGVGISDKLFDNDPLYWRQRVKEHLEMDGQRVDKIRVTEKSIDVMSDY